MSGWEWAAIAFGTWCALSVPAGILTGRLLRRRTEPPAAGPPVPPEVSAGQTPYPPFPLPGQPPGRAVPAAPPVLGHGGLVTTVDIYADGRTEITDHRKGTAEIFPGECPQCQDGACHLCGFYPAYDPARDRVVHRYQACPAHAKGVRSDGL